MNYNYTINGMPLSSMGVMLVDNPNAALLAPAPVKEVIQNDDPKKNGVQVLPTNPLIMNEREVTLTFLIQGTSDSDFLAKYTSFVQMLMSGIITLYVPDLNNYYRLLYSSSTQFENWRLNACKLAVKFREPDPTNRGAE